MQYFLVTISIQYFSLDFEFSTDAEAEEHVTTWGGPK